MGEWDGDLEYKDIIQPGHMNPDYLRYEKHRVWVVDATLKPDARHIYKRRTFYLDEDSWQILVEDAYDNRDQLWRVSEGHAMTYYNVPSLWTSLETHIDLLPEGGSLVVFLSAGFEHEVLPATRERMSITGWFFRNGR